MNKSIIEKYYKGETSLEEERELKIAFSSEEIKSDDYYTQLIFNTFAEEKDEETPISVKTFSLPTGNSSKKTFNYKKWISIATGVAACFLIVFGLLFYKNAQANNAYVIINGVQINDEKLALQYIKESFEEEERINEIARTQLQEMEKLENELNEIANNILNN